MADSFAQLVRCATRQWAGLSEAERVLLTARWAERFLPSAGLLRACEAGQIHTPIWSVRWGLGELVVMSVKDDYYGEPAPVKPVP